ncbi:uncharacterized protein [Panulirus ornatus]|uniref:uncharacterized protein n=1 Tax=Panulirus ornatus TaxID=150431 RepID=UPI003A8702D2
MRETLVLLLGMLVFVASLARAHKVTVKNSLTMAEKEEDEEEGEWDLEAELLGQGANIYRGYNILDESSHLILSDPSERVLRAVVYPEESAHGLTLEKVKALYQRQVEAETKADSRHPRYTISDFEDILAREEQATKTENAAVDDSIFQRLVSLIR